MEDNKEKVQAETAEETPAEETEEAAAEETSEAEEVSENDTEKSEEAPAEETPAQKEEDEALQTKFLRLSADFQNYKRRTEKEKSDIYAYANEKIVVEILGVLDNFERALSAGCSDEKFLAGTEGIYKQLKSIMDKNNVKEIEAENKPFDPTLHNAVMTDSAAETESGMIVNVFQKGYTLNGKVIRPAMVSVRA